MKRIRIGAAMPALLVLSPLGGGVLLLHGCVPDPDISDLPPYDGGIVQADVTIGTQPDSSSPDTGTDSHASDAADTGAVEASTQTATIQGVVLDYTQGAGVGVVPGATVSVLGTSLTTTTGTDGTFVLPNVPAGTVQVDVSNPVSAIQPITYSTNQLVLTVAGGQTVTVEPTLLEGCAGDVTMGSGGDGGVGITIANASCGGRQTVGDYVAVTFQDGESLVDPSTGVIYSGTARVEMIPLAFPKNGSVIDYSWGAALPGRSTQVDSIGAVEVRVTADVGSVQTGTPLAIASQKTVTLTLPISPANTSTASVQGYAPWYYDAVNGKWVADANGSVLGTTPATLGGGNGTNTITIKAPHLTWWSVTNPVEAPDGSAIPSTGCYQGSLTLGGAPVAGVWVHAIGSDWLGTSSAVTDAQGTFCIDAKVSSHVTLQAASVSSGGTISTVSSTLTQTSGVGGSCALGTGCQMLPAIPLETPVTACASGTYGGNVGAGNAPGDAGVAATLGVTIAVSGLTPGQTSAGIVSSAYIGETTSAASGAFCAKVPQGANVTLVDPSLAGKQCPATASFAVPTTQQAGTCGATGCFDAGEVFYGCY